MFALIANCKRMFKIVVFDEGNNRVAEAGDHLTVAGEWTVFGCIFLLTIIFVVAEPFQAKLVVKRSAVRKRRKLFKCRLCDKIFDSASQFKQHQRVHTGPRVLKKNSNRKQSTIAQTNSGE